MKNPTTRVVVKHPPTLPEHSNETTSFNKVKENI